MTEPAGRPLPIGRGAPLAFVLVSGVVVWLACGIPEQTSPGAADAAQVEAQLLEADRVFARATEERGLDGWVGAMADDVARIDLQGSIARGREAVRKLDAGLFADPTVRLTWDPTDAGIFADGRHGFTRGKYKVIRSGGEAGDGRTIGSGEYVSLWRRDDGIWKLILDTGAPDPPATEGSEREP